MGIPKRQCIRIWKFYQTEKFLDTLIDSTFILEKTMLGQNLGDLLPNPDMGRQSCGWILWDKTDLHPAQLI